MKVVVNDPDAREPCTAPAAPPSDYISFTVTSLSHIFLIPFVCHSSKSSAIYELGVIG